MRWENVYAQLGDKCVNTGSVVSQQRETMQNFIQSLQGTDVEAERLENSLLLQKQLQGKRLEGDESLISQFMNDLEEALAIDIDANLNLSEESRQAALRVISEDKFKAIKAIKNKYGLSAERKTIQYGEYKALMNKLQIAINNSSNKDGLVVDKVREIVEQLNQYNPEFFNKNGKADVWRSLGKRGSSASFADGNQATMELAKLMNLGSALVTMGSLAQNIGKVGEYFGAAAVAVAYAKEDESIEQVLQELIKSGKGSNGNLTIQITGEDKSAKGFYSDDAGNFVQGLQKREDAGEFFYHLHATDDKVDFMITTKDNPNGITFSMKNYADTSVVTILSGNIFPILARYNTFIEHYIALLMSNPDYRPNQVVQMYEAAKFTVGIHALVGGVRALSNDGSIITTPTASYFVVNNNKSTTPGSIRVYNTKTLAEAIMKQVELIEFVGGDKINTPYNPSVKFDDRFSGISVELHLRQLRNSLPQKS